MITTPMIDTELIFQHDHRPHDHYCFDLGSCPPARLLHDRCTARSGESPPPCDREIVWSAVSGSRGVGGCPQMAHTCAAATTACARTRCACPSPRCVVFRLGRALR